MKPLSVHIDPPQTHCEIEFPQDFDALEKSLRTQIGKRKFLVVTDENVAKYVSFVNRFKDNLLILPGSEINKNWKAVNHILTECFEREFDRQSVLVAIGGGVVGDMAGFTAAIFFRGIPFLQVPTTLLAQVDASIGGKTGIDYEYGKNTVGAIHQPEKIYDCPEFLKTLPESEIKNGLAEMIKHGIIASKKHFEDLEKIANTLSPSGRDKREGETLKGILSEIIKIVPDSVAIKAKIVEQDEREHGDRIFLNLGHTSGHAIELLSKYTIPHGRAVAIGTMMAVQYSLEQEMCSDQLVDRIENIFNKFDIDLMCDFTEEEIWEAMKHDKKKKDGKIRLVLPKKIGEVEVVSV